MVSEVGDAERARVYNRMLAVIEDALEVSMATQNQHILFATARLDARGRDPGGYIKLCMDSMRGVVLFRDFCTATSQLPVGATNELSFADCTGWDVVRELGGGKGHLRVANLAVSLITEDVDPLIEIIGSSNDVVVRWHIAPDALRTFGDEQYWRNFDCEEIDHYEYIIGVQAHTRYIAVPRNECTGTHVNVLQVISGESKDFDPRPFFNR